MSAAALVSAVSIFLSAFLVFIVQPLVGKHILPWFGGVPGVWALCLAFYQTSLFLGYAYAHLLVRLAPGRQILIHAALAVAAGFALPVLPDVTWKPDGVGEPSTRILAMLAVNVGPAFLFLAATGPLVQAWFARALPSRNPYPLYALSNLGSFLALLAYPLLIEPVLPLTLQSRAFDLGFLAVAPAIIACAWLTRRGSASGGLATSVAIGARREESIWLWALLPFCAVVLLTGITSKLCQDVASNPLLWLVPLSIYLLTFVLCFASERTYRRNVFVPLSLLALIGVGWGPAHMPSLWSSPAFASEIQWQVVFYSLALFCGCAMAHGELYRLRPGPQRLTAYYLWIAGGGAAGGIFVGVVAPLLFSNYHELPLGWVACFALVALLCLRRPEQGTRVPSRAFAAVVLAVGLLGMPILTMNDLPEDHLRLRHRNFFGVLRVLEGYPDNPERHRFIFRSGNTLHGFQPQHPEVRRLATTYYGSLSGVGFALTHVQRESAVSIGAIGLGIGTLAAHGRAGDSIEFYEIDPDVLEIARRPDLFTYLSDSPAEISVTLGDARLSLEAQLDNGGSKRFDLLVVDAFSSDSIPVHLLTVEAVELYVKHLAPDGVLAFHISNKNLNLAPLISRLGVHLGLEHGVFTSAAMPRYFQTRSRWVLLTRSAETLRAITQIMQATRRQIGVSKQELFVNSVERQRLARAPLWTDDYSDLFTLLLGSMPPPTHGS